MSFVETTRQGYVYITSTMESALGVCGHALLPYLFVSVVTSACVFAMVGQRKYLK